MLVGTFIGTLMLGSMPGVGLNEIFQSSLGNENFIWICEIVLLIGLLFELFKKAGVLGALAGKFSKTGGDRRKVELSAWMMGFMIVDDYFSPLLTGAIIRPLSDKAKVPREKLAFILDSTTSSVCILVPFTAWGAYLASLISIQGGPIGSAEEALTVYIGSIIYNFYPMLMLLFTLLICSGLLPDFGPMRKAERRVRETGALIRPGSRPLAGDDELIVGNSDSHPASLLLELLMPIVLLVGVATWSLIYSGSVKIVEAFMLADVWLICVLLVNRKIKNMSEVGDVIVDGGKSVLPALLIIAMAYALNAITSELGAADVIIELFADILSPGTLVALTFFMTAVISFSTGTSWGSYALMIPVALPLAFSISGGELSPLVYQSIAAVAGGGIFGDHASPVSDTTVLSSVGAGSDHIDHVVTQMPYALVVAGVTVALYMLL
jgi:Na+/H+ antiporter NhaC